jgi:hypothetical protein
MRRRGRSRVLTSARTAMRSFDLQLAIATLRLPPKLYVEIGTNPNDSGSVWRQQGGSFLRRGPPPRRRTRPCAGADCPAPKPPNLGLTSELPGVVERALRPSTADVIVERIGFPRWKSVRGIAHDRNDLFHDITAGATGSIFQQILDRRADLCFRIVTVYEIPIELV